jgi:hypothetical protein
MTNVWVKSTKILSVLASKNFITSTIKLFKFYDICGNKNGMTNKNFPLLFWCCCWIRDPGSEIQAGMDKNQDPGTEINIPDPQHWP